MALTLRLFFTFYKYPIDPGISRSTECLKNQEPLGMYGGNMQKHDTAAEKMHRA